MKTVEVFTDGSCIKKNTQISSGYGIHFQNNELPDISRKFTHKPYTNQRAELFAIYVTLIIVKKFVKYDKLIIYTDSMYSMNCILKWAPVWIKNSWKTYDKKNVKNKDIIEPLYSIYTSMKNVYIEHVTSHLSDNSKQTIGNNIVDKLAKDGANKKI